MLKEITIFHMYGYYFDILLEDIRKQIVILKNQLSFNLKPTTSNKLVTLIADKNVIARCRSPGF